MPVITRLDAKKTVNGRLKKVRVYLDGRYAFSLEPEAAAGLKLNQELDAGSGECLKAKNERLRCLSAAYRYLANRPHAKKELAQKLGRRFDADTIEVILAQLEERKLINDAEFASYWRDSRETFKPRSRRLTELELKQKGVSPEAVKDATSGMDDAASAYRAASGKARLLRSADADTFQRRIGQYLRRRGYGYEVIKKTTDALWREKSI